MHIYAYTYYKMGDIMEWAGLWAHMGDKEAMGMEKHIEDFGKRSTKSLLKRANRI